MSLEDFRADLDVFSGPLDLLLYLIKREEVAITDVAISSITDRYVAMLSQMRVFDINTAAEFLVMAATLMEIKSRSLLPQGELEDEHEQDPHGDLVRQLLEYRSFKNAAEDLASRAKERAKRFIRPPTNVELDDEPEEPLLLLEDVDVWDLVSAFGKVIQETQMGGVGEIVCDELPVATYIEEVMARLQGGGERLEFLSFFRKERSKARIIGIFLALLELTKQRIIRLCQDESERTRLSVSLRPEADREPPSRLQDR